MSTRGKTELIVPPYVTRELKRWLTRKNMPPKWMWATITKKGLIEVTFEYPTADKEKENDKPTI